MIQVIPLAMPLQRRHIGSTTLFRVGFPYLAYATCRASETV